MKFDIEILRIAQDLAAHATYRQSIIAQNIANADTPGYKARDVGSFADRFRDNSQLCTSRRPARSGHIKLGSFDRQNNVSETAIFGAESPNGNTVSLEDQLVRAADVKYRHDLALGIYAKSISIYRAGLGRIR